MKKELITYRNITTSVKVAANEINAIRTKDIVKKGVRVYEDGLVGFSGAIGNKSDDLLIEEAKDNLKVGIAYPYPLTSQVKDHRDLSQKTYSPSELKTIMEEVLAVLSDEYSEFMFSHMLTYSENESTMTNTEGLDLRLKDSYLDLGLILKERGSANIFDGFIGYTGRHFDLNRFLSFNRHLLDAHKKSVDLPEGERLPVFFIEGATMGEFLSRQLDGEKYATQASIYSGKMGHTLFNDKITIYHSQDSEKMMCSFYDKEGVVLEGDKVPLVEEGRLVAVCTDKKTAEDYDLPHTGGASGSYDSKPTLYGPNIDFAIDSEDLLGGLEGQKALFVVVNSGGDFTPDGTYASPVQVAYLYDGKEILGKLPEFSISSHIEKMLGEDYIGTFSTPDLYFGDHMKIMGCYMQITKGDN